MDLVILIVNIYTYLFQWYSKNILGVKGEFGCNKSWNLNILPRNGHISWTKLSAYAPTFYLPIYIYSKSIKNIYIDNVY